MLGYLGVELVKRSSILASDNLNTGQQHRRYDGSFSSADRTVTTPWRDYAIRQIEFEFYRATMARKSMLWFDGYATHKLDHFELTPSTISGLSPSAVLVGHFGIAALFAASAARSNRTLS